MDKSFVKPVILFTFVLAQALGFSSALTILEHEQNVVTTYIVHLEKSAPEVFNDDDLEKWYTSFLPTSLKTPDQMMKRMVHSYRNLFTGFAVKLTEDEAKALTLVDGVVSLRREQEYSLHTTHTPSFLGLRQDLGLWKGSSLGKGVIIGVIDTGIFPDHPSFSDEGMPPPPAKWKGSCDFNGTLCNNKLIGAQNFVKDNVTVSPIDDDGHGTHTSSTAAGNFVVDANALGQAKGTAAGIAPLAHVAMYRVCAEGCFESDILAAMDAAVGDGVDILSISLGGHSKPFYTDGIALGAFRAIQKGIFVSCSAGNSGPFYNTLSNEAPWILTVGASTVDRVIKATARLGDGAEYDGQSVFQPVSFNSSKLLPLVYPGSIGDSAAAFCQAGSLRNASIVGKVVLCAQDDDNVSGIARGQEVKDAGGAAVILINNQFNGFSTLAESHVVPAISVSYNAGLEILAYINSTSNPTATIVFKGTIIGDPTAPAMASFSSRGPSAKSPGILKPDITGPGNNILAAWPVSLDNSTITKANFNIISGTSMSCPHLSGIAALLKSLHPNWSPAAIKSAIMTSADTLNHEKKPIIDQRGLAANIFAVGSGHVNPSRAQNPGLVYDLTPEDYIPYLCGLGYSDTNITTIVQSNVQCSQVSAISETQLNYPSFSVIFGQASQTYTRTVTNVGPISSTYTYTLVAPEGVHITVTPAELTFSDTSQTATYTITFSVNGTGGKNFSQGALTWSSGLFSVRSPIAVIFKGGQ